MTFSLIIPVDDILKDLTLVIGFERDLFNTAKTIHDAQVQLCSELDICCSFSADDRTDKRLADAYDPVQHRMCPVIVHVLLLFADLLYDLYQSLLFVICLIAVISEPADVVKVSFDK